MTIVADHQTERDAEQRAAVIDAFQQFVDYLRDNPQVPIDHHAADIAFHLGVGDRDSVEHNLAQLDAIAKTMGVEVTTRHGHHTATRWFGPLRYRVVYIPPSVMARHNAEHSYEDNVQVDEPVDLHDLHPQPGEQAAPLPANVDGYAAGHRLDEPIGEDITETPKPRGRRMCPCSHAVGTHLTKTGCARCNCTETYTEAAA